MHSIKENGSCLFIVTYAQYKGEWVSCAFIKENGSCHVHCIKENGSCLFIVTCAQYKGEWVMSIYCDMCTV